MKMPYPRTWTGWLVCLLTLWMFLALGLSGRQARDTAGATPQMATSPPPPGPVGKPDLWGVWFSTQSQSCKGTGAKMRCRAKGTFAVSNKGDASFPAFSIAFAVQGVPDTSVIKAVKFLKPGHGKKISVSFKLPPGVSAQGKKLVASFPGNLVTSQIIP